TAKPVARTRASAEAAARACADAGRVLAVGFNWRYQPALQEIRRMLRDGRLGRLLHIEGNFNGPSVYRFPQEHWRQQREEGPAGGMTGRGVHLVDSMLYLAGPIDSVFAQSARLTLDYGLDDTTSMLNAQPTVIDYPQASTERAELEGFADAIEGRAPYACPPDDAVHGVAVLEAIVRSAQSGQREPIA